MNRRVPDQTLRTSFGFDSRRLVIKNASDRRIIDEGIDINHPDLQANIWTNPSPGSISEISGHLHGYDFINGSGTIPAEPHAEQSNESDSHPGTANVSG